MLGVLPSVFGDKERAGVKKKPYAFMVPVSLLVVVILAVTVTVCGVVLVGYMALVISYLVASNRRIYRMSHTDQGTQLLNRRAPR